MVLLGPCTFLCIFNSSTAISKNNKSVESSSKRGLLLNGILSQLILPINKSDDLSKIPNKICLLLTWLCSNCLQIQHQRGNFHTHFNSRIYLIHLSISLEIVKPFRNKGLIGTNNWNIFNVKKWLKVEPNQATADKITNPKGYHGVTFP